jgi:hypothetical protein
LRITRRKKIDPEEYEQHLVARESERQSQADFHVVERVIGIRDGDEETEYFVKCKLLLCPSLIRWLIVNREGAYLRVLHMGNCNVD